MAILGFSSEDVTLGQGLTQGSEQVSQFAATRFLEDEELTIIAHSSDSFWSGKPKRIGGLDAKEFAAALVKKYGDKKRQLKHVYLLACEAGLWVDNEPPLAYQFALELRAKGFEIDVHAMTPPSDVSDAGGQVVSLVEIRAPKQKTVVDSYVYKTDRHRTVDETIVDVESKDLKSVLSDDDYQFLDDNHFKLKTPIMAMPPLDRDSYRWRMRCADFTYKAEKAPQQYCARHSETMVLLSQYIEGLKEEQEKKHSKNRESSIACLQTMALEFANLQLTSRDDVVSVLEKSLTLSRELYQKQGYHFVKQNKHQQALDVIDALLQNLGRPIEKKGVLSSLFQSQGSSLKVYKKLFRQCKSLTEEIKRIDSDIPDTIKEPAEEIDKTHEDIVTEALAAEKLPQLEAFKESLTAHLQHLQAEKARRIIAEVANKLSALEKYDGDNAAEVREKLRAFKQRAQGLQQPTYAELQAASQLLTDIIKYEDNHLSEFKWQQLQQQFKVLRTRILAHESAVCGHKIELNDLDCIDDRQLSLDDKVLTTLNAMSSSFRGTLERQCSSGASISDVLERSEHHIETLSATVQRLDTSSYKAVEKLIEKFDRKSKSFFSINCKKKADKIRQAVQKVDVRKRDHILRDKNVLEAINYHRLSFLCFSSGNTKSYKALESEFASEINHTS